MKSLISFVLCALLAGISLSASAGVAPNTGSSAMSQSGAKIAAPAKPSADQSEDKKEPHNASPRDSAR